MLNFIIKNANVFTNGKFQHVDIRVGNGVVTDISAFLPADDSDVVFSFDNCILLPGLSDVHVHLREPGFSYKEDITSGTAAAARGGFTSVCSMPNLNPAPDCAETLQQQLNIISSNAIVNVYPYGTITEGRKGETLSDMEGMAENAVAFTDDGSGIQTPELMKEAMLKAKSLGKVIAAHCEDNSLLFGGYIHDGEYAKKNGHKGICSESEWKQIERDIELVRQTGCRYHVCHISAKESVELIRKAKAEGLPVTCETAPHYLVFDDSMLKENGRFKMNPPIRSAADREALIQGICDGTIDLIATDHAPHSAEEKNGGLKNSLMGVVGLETSFPAVYTYMVKGGYISLEKTVELMNTNAQKIFGIGCDIAVGNSADFCVYDLNESYEVNPNEFLSMGRSTPFEGLTLYGKCKMTMVKGGIVWQEN